jgi:hypothetical protein
MLFESYKSISIFCDASIRGYGYVIRFNDDLILERARLWKQNQIKWDINGKELFGPMEALLVFHELQKRSLPVPITVFSDSKVSLSWIRGEKPVGTMPTRSGILIERYLEVINELVRRWSHHPLTFERIKGSENPADAPSRLPHDLDPDQNLLLEPANMEDKEENEDPLPVVCVAGSLQQWTQGEIPTFLGDYEFPPLVQLWAAWRKKGIDGYQYLLRQMIKNAQEESEALKLQVAYLKNGRSSGLRMSTIRDITKFRFIDNELLFELRFPDGDITLKPMSVICLDTDSTTGRSLIEHYASLFHRNHGHSSMRHVSWLMSRAFSSHGMKRVVKEVINNCEQCRRKLILQERRAAYVRQRHLDSFAVRFFQYVSIDLYTVPGEKKKRGKTFVLVLVDHFSRFTILEALTSKTAGIVDKTLTDVFDR